MLNSDQIGRLRKFIESNPNPSSFEGFHIDRRTVVIPAIPLSSEVVQTETSIPGRMYVPQEVFGTPFNQSCLNGIGNHTVDTTDKSLVLYRNATVVGNGAVLGDFGLASPNPIADVAQFDQFRSQNSADVHGYLLSHDQETRNTYAYFVASEVKQLRPGTGLFFHNLEPYNYGSFLFRVLPQMLFFAQSDNVDFDFYITPGRTSWFMEAIRLIGLPNRPVFSVSEVIGDSVERLLMYNEFDDEGWADQKTRGRIEALTEKVLKLAGSGAPKFGDSLYVSRRLGGAVRPNYRRLTNEDDVIDLSRYLGLNIIYPETLTLSDQITVFSRAKVVVGPSGSGMLNAIFSPKSTKVLDMESFHFTVRQHAKIYSSSEKVYSYVFGTIPGQPSFAAFSNWEIDLSLVRKGVDWALSS